MTTFTAAKSSPNKSDAKNASLAMKSRQQAINEVNKRRTLLQDNSWIKKRPEEETVDENYGRVVLNQYKSQDSLHRNADEKEDQKALLSRYRSDTTLDRISDKNNADKANKLPTLDSRQNNGKELVVSGNLDSATSPVKKKRQSWMPPPIPGQKPTNDNMEQHKRRSWTPPNTAAALVINDVKQVASTSEKREGPKMTVYSSEPITSPKPNNMNDKLRTRQVSPIKPSESDADRNAATETTGRSQDLDNLIQVNAAGEKSEKRSQDLDNLIQVNAANANSQRGDLDDLIKVKPASNGCNKGTLDNLIKVNPTANGYNKGGRDLDNFIDVNNIAPQNKRNKQLDDLIVIKSSTVDQNTKWTPEQDCGSANAPDKQVDTNHSYQVTQGSSYNASSGYCQPKDTIVYTRTYENSRFPHDAYEENIHGKSIQTVYSTSDRAIIEKEMCTYCRKPLGTDTKMILEALQICCHATCFQCEVCQAPLENLKAGDSIWIHKNTVHCEPCYSKVKASWIY